MTPKMKPLALPHLPWRETLYWVAAPLACLCVHWRAWTAWFRADDFAWLGLARDVHGLGDFLRALFVPLAEGTVRPWSERLFFMVGTAWFGLDPIPFRAVVFATQFANLALVAAIGARLTGRREAGLYAALLWLVHSSMIEPMGWLSAYNQVLGALFLLLAFYALLRGWRAAEWALFVAGLGAHEMNVVYPVIAAAWLALRGERRAGRRTLPMLAVSALYVAVHARITPPQRTGEYAMHFTGSMVRTLGRYWSWSVGPSLGWTPILLPAWVIPLGVIVLTVALGAFAVRKGRFAVFFLVWYVAAIAPVLPLRDHRMQYYVFAPMIGVCWLAGWAIAEHRKAAAAFVCLYLLMVVPRTVAASAWNARQSQRARALVEGVAAARERHPGKAILLDGVDLDLFANSVENRPFRLYGIDQVYLAPGGPLPPNPFVLPAELVYDALDNGRLEVYDVRGPLLRNITWEYSGRPRQAAIPVRLDVGDPLAEGMLGPEWYSRDGGHRWMPKRATLRIGAPAVPGAGLYLEGRCAAEQLPQTVTVSVNGRALPPAVARDEQFLLVFPLPDDLAGRGDMRLVIEAARTVRPKSDPRELGLAFGVIEVK